jgi:hypothetical protein
MLWAGLSWTPSGIRQWAGPGTGWPMHEHPAGKPNLPVIDGAQIPPQLGF